jgi:hypothetical protein
MSREIYPLVRSLLVYSGNGSISSNTLNVDKISRVFIRDEPILSSERMLYKDYYRKGPVEKTVLVMIVKGLDAKTN